MTHNRSYNYNILAFSGNKLHLLIVISVISCTSSSHNRSLKEQTSGKEMAQALAELKARERKAYPYKQDASNCATHFLYANC